MTPIPSNIGSLSATPYVDAFTTGEILGFVVLIICTQIVITWIAVAFIRRHINRTFRNFITGFNREVGREFREIKDRLPERI